MKTKKSFKKLLYLVSLAAIFSLSLATMAFADAPTVTWKETKEYVSPVSSETVEVGGYDSATGTFNSGARTITSTGNKTDGTNHQYYLGVEFSEGIESGKIIVDAEFSGVSAPEGSDIGLFALADSKIGWGKKVESNLQFVNGKIKNKNTSPSSWYSPKDGVHSLRLVAVAGDEESNWDIKIYRNESELIHNYTVQRDTLSDIKSINCNSWVAGGRSIALTVDKFQVTYEEIVGLKITSATDGNVAYNAPLSVTFDSQINPSTINDIKLKQGETEVNATVELDDQTNTVTIRPTAPLVDEKNYQIVIPTTVTSVSGLTLSNPEIINITAVDAIYYTNAGSKYNPAASNIESATTTEFKDGKLILTGYPVFKMGKTVTSGVYYFDLKYKVNWVAGQGYQCKVGLRKSNDIGFYIMQSKNASEIRTTVINGTNLLELKYGTDTYKSTDTSNNIFDLRFVVESASAEADWKVSVYDKAAPERGAIFVGRYTKAELPDIIGLSFDKTKALEIEVYDLIIREKDTVNVASFDYNESTKTVKAGFATVTNGKAFAAAYAEDGRFIEMQSKDLTYEMTKSDPDDLSFTFENNGIAEVKVMVWDGFDSLKPLLLKPYK